MFVFDHRVNIVFLWYTQVQTFDGIWDARCKMSCVRCRALQVAGNTGTVQL